MDKKKYILFMVPCLLMWFNELGSSQTISWKQTNGPFSGSIYAITVNANGHIFSGVWAGGIFRSTNGGSTWTSIGDPQLSVTALVMNNSGDIFAVGGGILRSTNNGDTWEGANGGITGPGVCSIFIEPNGDLFAGTQGGGVFRSTNNASSWMDANGLGLTNFFCYAFASFSNSQLFMATDDGIFKTTDDGQHWSQTGLSGISIGQLLIGDDGNIFAGYYNVSDGGVYRSIDSGQTWTKFDTGLTDKTIRSLFQSSNRYLYAGTTHGGVFRSTNNGESWIQTNSGLRNLFIRSLASDSSKRLLAGTADGVAASTDNGNTWNQIGVPHSFANCISISSEDVVFASTYQGVWQSTDNGGNWRQTALAQDATLEFFTINSGEYLFAGNCSTYYSTNRGEQWHQIDSGLVGCVRCFACDSSGHVYAGTQRGILRLRDDFVLWSGTGLDSFIVNSIAIAPNGVLFAGTERSRPYAHNGVFRSKDGGVNWTQVLDDTTIGCLLIHSDDCIIAATKSLTSCTYRSTNNGESWTTITNGLKGNVCSLAKNSSGHTFAGTTAGVFRSTDHGDSWSNVSLGLPTLTVTDVAINSMGFAFAATYGNGVYRTTQPTTSVNENMHALPDIFSLYQNYPNPFNPSTTIEFAVPYSVHASLKIYNVLGQEIAVLFSGKVQQGNHRVIWQPTGIASGIYFYRIESSNFNDTKKLVLIQ
jgi:photosystem II stability/assembly factor-like uncharacterized protein